MVTICKSGKEGSPETKLAGTLIFHFSASRTVINKCLSFKPLSGIFFWQLEQTKTVPLPYPLKVLTPSFPLCQGAYYFPEAAIHLGRALPVGKFLHLQGGNLPIKASTQQPKLCLWTPQNKAIHSSPIPLQIFAGRDLDHPIHFRFPQGQRPCLSCLFACPHTLHNSCPRKKACHVFVSWMIKTTFLQVKHFQFL